MAQGLGSPALAMGLPVVASIVGSPSLKDRQSAGSSPASTSSAKRKRTLRSKPSKVEKRSSSMPQLHGGIRMESTSDSPDCEKKRNKLGYQRTAIACGHCRRRKIRCMVAIDDTSTTCENCKKLQKECNYYPVECSSPPTKSLQTASNEIPEALFPRGISTPPAATQQGFSIGQIDESPPPPAVPFPSYNFPSRSEEHGNLNVYAASEEPVAYPRQHEHYPSWQRTSLQILPSHHPAIHNSPKEYEVSGYWKPFEPPLQSPRQTQPHPFSSLPHATLHNETYTSNTTPRIQAGWHEPSMRSISFGDIDTVHRSFPRHSLSVPRDISRRASNFSFAPPVITSEHSIPAISEETSGTMSGPPFSQGSQRVGGYSVGQQATWSTRGTHLSQRYSTVDTQPAEADPYSTHLPHQYSVADTEPAKPRAYNEQWYPG